MIDCLTTQALAFLAVFVFATHATQAIAFEWKPGLSFIGQLAPISNIPGETVAPELSQVVRR